MRTAGDGGQPDERCGIEKRAIVVLAEPHRVETQCLCVLALHEGLFKVAARLKRTQPDLLLSLLLKLQQEIQHSVY